MTSLEYKLFFQRHLPHYQPTGATLFITFRLAGSLPRETIERLKADALHKETEIKRLPDESSRRQAYYQANKQLFGMWDTELDARQHGPDWLFQPAVAKCVCDALHYRDGKVYTLEAYCVMPNHVHLVCTPQNDGEGDVYPLSRIMHSLKCFTARQANQLLGRQGDFWQHESYDHVVRDNSEFIRIVNYVLENPARAGLKNQWTYCRADL